MRCPQFGQELSGGPGASGFHLLIALADTLNGFFKVLPFPFQVRAQRLIEGSGEVLAAPLRVCFKLCLAFWRGAVERKKRRVPDLP